MDDDHELDEGGEGEEGDKGRDDDEEEDKEKEEEEEQSEGASKGKKRKASAMEAEAKPTKQKKASKGRVGVSRGIDFQDVRTVFNFDMPLSVKSYTHRIGRTARGGKNGVALTLVNMEEDADLDVLDQVLKQQRATTANDTQIEAEATLKPLEISTEDLDGFAYRVEGVSRKVTKLAIREARLRQIKNEMINSAKLKAHFEDNP